MALHKVPTIGYLKFNDIPVINWPNRMLNTLAIIIRRGTFHDPVHLEGAHHGIEHVICGKSATYSSEDLVLLMERLFGGTDGPDIKIFTVETYTSYGFRDMPDRKTFREAGTVMAVILRDGIIECHNMHRDDGRQFDLGSLLTERAAIGNEVRQRKDDLPLAVAEELLRLMYHGTTNPARLAGTGNLKQLRKLVKPTTLKSIAADGYVPSEMAVIGIGPTQSDLLELCAATGLDQLKPYKAAKPLYDGSDTEPHFKTIVTGETFRPAINQSHVIHGWPAPTFTSKDGPALDVLARILKMRTEMRMRDENNVMDAGLYHPSSAWRATKWHGALDVWFATAGDAAYAEWGTEQVLGVCSQLKDDHSVSLDKQVDAVRLNMVSALAQEWKWFPDLICERISDHYANGDTTLEHLVWYEDAVSKVTPADIRRVAGKYLTTDRFARATVHPLYVPPEIVERATEESKPYLRALLRPAE
jgi:predicted Zn-dependent peptidase